jgi:hypothetical protein
MVHAGNASVITRADNEVSQAPAEIPRRRRIHARTADVSAWGAHRQAIGRYIGGAPINCAPTGFPGMSECTTKMLCSVRAEHFSSPHKSLLPGNLVASIAYRASESFEETALLFVQMRGQHYLHLGVEVSALVRMSQLRHAFST